ncbi:MAG: HypC/HybG/HupF family hydrogenase formation chaperone [Candidatus Cloacimonetes bacterium]|nr:HypC/HybG/HupF family hydrogenase formation chaperone [Candidatus Cloacimonadota bacterium]
MCLAIPGKIIKISQDQGTVDLGGISQEVSLTFIPQVTLGDWVLIHTGFAINIISESDALQTIELLQAVYAK